MIINNEQHQTLIKFPAGKVVWTLKSSGEVDQIGHIVRFRTNRSDYGGEVIVEVQFADEPTTHLLHPIWIHTD